jgi:hypothetical protein
VRLCYLESEILLERAVSEAQVLVITIKLSLAVLRSQLVVFGSSLSHSFEPVSNNLGHCAEFHKSLPTKISN